MKNLRTLLVDDEYLALNLLEQFIKKLPDLEIVGKVKSATHALDILQKEPIDLLFLDIQMPILSGTNLLKKLDNPPATIFTTAYSEYAVDAFNLNAVDYLLKPFSFERFLQSIDKARAFLNTTTTPSVSEASEAFLTVKVDGRIEKITISNILYIEGLKEYIKIVTPLRTYVTYESLKNMVETLHQHGFVRTHKSYIVSKHKVKSLEGNLLDLGTKTRIPISRERKDAVVKAIFE